MNVRPLESALIRMRRRKQSTDLFHKNTRIEAVLKKQNKSAEKHKIEIGEHLDYKE